MKPSVLIFFIYLFLQFNATAQYAPQAGVAGSTAISASSSQLVGWANACTLYRGYQYIDSPIHGYASLGDESSAIGPVDHDIVSLGDSGVAVLQFYSAIYNGPGPDFAVFENGFQNPANAEEAFLELAFVEVSSDGVNFYRFPANSLTQTTTQIRVAGDYMNARTINNLAGKYMVNYGTPFDLEELSGIPGLDIDNITHVRLVDVVGSITNHASLDSAGRKINDPYPTIIPSSGFDLDAVGVIHQKYAAVGTVAAVNGIGIYPNPAVDQLYISLKCGEANITIISVTGEVLHQQKISTGVNEVNISSYPKGIYFLQLQINGNKWVEKITKS